MDSMDPLFIESRDKLVSIVEDENGRRYKIQDDEREYTSVTQYIHSKFPFDKYSIAKDIALKELHIKIIKKSKLTEEVIIDHEVSNSQEVNNNQEEKEIAIHFEEGKISKRIKKIFERWDRLRENGNLVHKLIENYFMKSEMSDNPFFMGFMEFLKDSKFEIIRYEWKIFDETLLLGGTIDAVFLVGNNLIIVDWKTSEDELTTIKIKCGTEPFEFIPNCKYNHYSIQVSLYRYILETKYNLIIRRCKLVRLLEYSYQLLDINRVDMDKIVQHRVNEVLPLKK